MMVSQPRRIAASSLMKRLRQTLGDKVSRVIVAVAFDDFYFFD
jgi:HrpA-like RNA helicase